MEEQDLAMLGPGLCQTIRVCIREAALRLSKATGCPFEQCGLEGGPGAGFRASLGWQASLHSRGMDS